MPKKLDLVGQKFGKLTVIESAPNKGRRTQWKCKCECGNECIVLTESLRSGRTSSCGCLRSEQLVQRNRENVINLIGQRFGLLTVIEQAESNREHSCWVCKCDCGNIKTVNSVELKNGDTLSCGCLRSSFGEQAIEKILKENNISYKKEYQFSDLLSENNIPLRFDFVLFDENDNIMRIVEYDGEQHFLDKTNNFWKRDSLATRRLRDSQKNLYCYNHNYPIVRIPYWEKNNISLNLILGDKYLVQ